MSLNFQFHICSAKIFLKALNFLFTVVWILEQKIMRHFISKDQLEESDTKPKHHEMFNKLKYISYFGLLFFFFKN